MNACRSVFSSSTKSQTAPSTGEVLVELQRKTEKRKREDNEHSMSANDLTDNIQSASQNNCADHKRRKHDSDRTSTSSASEFVQPSPVIPETRTEAVTSSTSANQTQVGMSPKRDGHLRTAIASSYSSSRRSRVMYSIWVIHSLIWLSGQPL